MGTSEIRLILPRLRTLRQTTRPPPPTFKLRTHPHLLLLLLLILPSHLPTTMMISRLLVLGIPSTSSIRAHTGPDILHPRTTLHLKVLIGTVVFQIEVFAVMLRGLLGFVLLAALVDDEACDDAEEKDETMCGVKKWCKVRLDFAQNVG